MFTYVFKPNFPPFVTTVHRSSVSMFPLHFCNSALILHIRRIFLHLSLPSFDLPTFREVVHEETHTRRSRCINLTFLFTLFLYILGWLLFSIEVVLEKKIHTRRSRCINLTSISSICFMQNLVGLLDDRKN